MYSYELENQSPPPLVMRKIIFQTLLTGPALLNVRCKDEPSLKILMKSTVIENNV